jgi:NitT/TauT family transport system ATP-binding protein
MSFETLADDKAAPSGRPPATKHTKSGDYSIGAVLARCEDVSLTFKDREGNPKVILKPTTVEVRDIIRPGMAQGQVIGILGPSGIGKTQFSRILTGLQAPTTGKVLVRDFIGDPNGDSLRPIEEGLVGMVAQNYPLFSHRTVLGNLLVALEHTTLKKADKLAKINEYLTLFELTDTLDKYPIQLSGGQRQRIAIAREMLCSEHILVFDEPFTGLDPIMKDNVCALLNQVAQLHELNTLFVVAHDITALCQIADHLWLFGRERDEQGKPIPGATIKVQYDLIEQGLAWQPGIYDTPAFAEFVREVRAQFRTL